MIKLVGAILIIGASALYGFYRASMFAERPRQIRAIIHVLNRLSTEIGYGSTLLPNALGKLSSQTKKPLDQLFSSIAGKLQPGMSITVKEAWQASIEEHWSRTAMKLPEKEALLELGQSLGVSDREDQMKHLQLAVKQLQHEEAEASDEQWKYEKLCRSLGVLGGALIVILIY